MTTIKMSKRYNRAKIDYLNSLSKQAIHKHRQLLYKKIGWYVTENTEDSITYEFYDDCSCEHCCWTVDEQIGEYTERALEIFTKGKCLVFVDSDFLDTLTLRFDLADIIQYRKDKADAKQEKKVKKHKNHKTDKNHYHR